MSRWFESQRVKNGLAAGEWRYGPSLRRFGPYATADSKFVTASTTHAWKSVYSTYTHAILSGMDEGGGNENNGGENS